MSTPVHWTYALQYRRCGKNCSSCPHGPYWYGYRKVEGRTESRYIGIRFRSLEDDVPWWAVADPIPIFEPITRARTASVDLAWEILGDPPYRTRAVAAQARDELSDMCRKASPPEWRMVYYIACAWSYLAARNGWAGRAVHAGFLR